MELISLKATEGIFPRYSYQRIQVAHWWEYFSLKIDYGFGFLLRRIRIKYPSVVRLPQNVFDFANLRWIAVTGYSNAYIIPSADYTAINKRFFVYHTPVNGGGLNTGATEPSWPTKIGATVADGDLTWTCCDPLSIPGYSFLSPKLKVEIFDNANDKVRQSEPQILDLITSPGSINSYSYEAPSPADQTGYGLNNSCNPPLFSPTLNYLYRYGDIVWLKFSDQVQVDISSVSFWTPNIIDVFLEGYYVNERAFVMWKERKAV